MAMAEEYLFSASGAQHGAQGFRGADRAPARSPSVRRVPQRPSRKQAPSRRWARSRVARFLQTPKGQLLAVFLAMIAIAVPSEGDWRAVAAHVVRTVVAASILDLLVTR